MHQSIINLNKIFSGKIVERCKDKKVLLNLSGGLDTRAMLSVLCKYGIHCDAITYNITSRDPRDVKIPRKISKDIKYINNIS